MPTGRPRTNVTTARRAVRLAAAGHPRRAIARNLGIGKTTLYRLLAAAGAPAAANRHTRCPGCGGLVRPPCRLCTARRL